MQEKHEKREKNSHNTANEELQYLLFHHTIFRKSESAEHVPHKADPPTKNHLSNYRHLEYIYIHSTKHRTARKIDTPPVLPPLFSRVFLALQLERLVSRLLSHGEQYLPQEYPRIPQAPTGQLSTLQQTKDSDGGLGAHSLSTAPTPAPTPDVKGRSRSSSDATFTSSERDADDRVGKTTSLHEENSWRSGRQNENGERTPDAGKHTCCEDGYSPTACVRAMEEKSKESEEMAALVKLAAKAEGRGNDVGDVEMVPASPADASGGEQNMSAAIQQEDVGSEGEGIVEDEDIPEDVSSAATNDTEKDAAQNDGDEDGLVRNAARTVVGAESGGDQRMTKVFRTGTDSGVESNTTRLHADAFSALGIPGPESATTATSDGGATPPLEEMMRIGDDTPARRAAPVDEEVVDSERAIIGTITKLKHSQLSSLTPSAPPPPASPSQQLTALDDSANSRAMAPSLSLSLRSSSPPSSPPAAGSSMSSLSGLPLPPLGGTRSRGGLLRALPLVTGRALPSLGVIGGSREEDTTLTAPRTSDRVSTPTSGLTANYSEAEATSMSPALLPRQERLGAVGEGSEDERENVAKDDLIGFVSRTFEMKDEVKMKLGLREGNKLTGDSTGNGRDSTIEDKRTMSSPIGSPKQQQGQEEEEAGLREHVEIGVSTGGEVALDAVAVTDGENDNGDGDDDAKVLNTDEAEDLLHNVDETSSVEEDGSFEHISTDGVGSGRGVGDGGGDDYFS